MPRHWISTIGILAIVQVLSTITLARSANLDLTRAEEQYGRTEYRAAINTIQMLSPKSASGYALLGKAHFMEGQYKDATAYLERAVGQDPLNSEYYDCLGRAYGRLAERSGFLSALGYAKKTGRAFERAVALAPSNLEALSDLFEYYLQAPGIVGGGLDKAQGIAVMISRLNEAEYHYVCSRLAEKRNNIANAEQELRLAMKVAPTDVGRVLDFAAFLSSHGRYNESDEVFRFAEQIAPNSPKLLFARGAAYIQSKRNLDEAKRLLRRYLECQITPEDPPRSEVTTLLKAAGHCGAGNLPSERACTP